MVGFANPLFLFGLAAVGLPVLIHFLTKARPRPIRFPPFRLLVEAGGGRQALHRLRTFILLAVRTLAVSALALLFTRPYLKAPGLTTEPGAAQRVVLVVDASCSMMAVEGGVSLFTRARAQAAEVLRGLEPDSAAGVVFIGARPRSALPALSRNLSVLHEELTKAEATFEKGDPAAALAAAEGLLEGRGAIYVFGDFQRANWGSADFSPRSGVSLFLRPSASAEVSNVGLIGLEKAPGEPLPGENIELICTLFNSSPLKRLETVRLDLEGVSQTREAELRPYSSGTVVFSFSLLNAGRFAGKVALKTSDALEADDDRCFVVRVRPALRVLLVGDGDEHDTSAPAFFLAKALAPQNDSGGGLDVFRRRSQDVDRGILETADLFVLTAGRGVSGETVEVIARRVVEGAQLICFLDDAAAPELLNAFAGASQGSLTPPFRLSRLVRDATASGEPFERLVSAVGPLRIFDSPDQGELSDLRFHRHWSAETAAARKEEVLLRHADGSAALSFSPAGRGTVVFINFPVAPDGGNLAGSPLFPVLLHEILRALRRTGEHDDGRPGEDWRLDVPDVGSAAAVEERRIVGPDGEILESTVVSRGRNLRLLPSPARRPGHYFVRQAERTLEIGAVNVHPDESDLRPLNLSEHASAGDAKQGAVAVLSDDGSLAAAGRATALWPYLAAAAAFFFAAETLLLIFWRKKKVKSVPGFGVAEERRS